MLHTEDNDYDSEKDCNDYREFSLEILNEIEQNRKLSIIHFYKDKLYQEPEFTGIYSISSYDLLCLIENTNVASKLLNKDYTLSNEQIVIFDNMYIELFNKKSDINIYDSVTKKIFSKIYV